MTFETLHTKQDVIPQVLPCHGDGLVGSEHSEYDPVQKPKASENRMSPYIVRSQLCDMTLQIEESEDLTPWT